jgi:S-adenosylmethionine synthetase
MNSAFRRVVYNFDKIFRKRKYVFTSESVTEGHPDKLCDLISDNVLDFVLSKDPNGRVACEVFASKNLIVVGGEITCNHKVPIKTIVRQTLKKVGYTKINSGIDPEECEIIISLSEQSQEINQAISGYGNLGAGDQSLIFGYACNETPELMPLPIMLAHKLAKRLTTLRKNKKLPWVRPDGKTQVCVEYINQIPSTIKNIAIAVQHDPEISNKEIEKYIKREVIYPVCEQYISPFTEYYINKNRRFIFGGPQSDTGLTGRKIIVDTYGGIGRHGGGCFSGKDPTKIDRLGSYIARHIAKNIVSANIAQKCEVQLAYVMGNVEPISIYVDTFQTGIISEHKIENLIKKIFPLKPAEIIEYLDLKKPMYFKTATYGHFGRDEFPWEKTNKVSELKNNI